MTTRLYYQEPYRATFEAVVTSCQPSANTFHATLDQTAFYPTSGGQPFDTGRLGPAQVLDVVDLDDGEIAHVVDRPLQVGQRVSGAVDWPRRFDHMQQHTGQHVLSAAFDRLVQARTESFHLGVQAATIDLGRQVSAAEIADAEREANRIVWDDRPVTIRFATPEEAASLPLRKDPARTGPLRLIEIEDFDLSACGGTHVARTGAIGVIAIASAEKFRAGTRVEFLCGGRALARFHSWRDAFASAQRFLSVPPPELAAGIERLQAEGKSLQRTIRGLQEQLAVHEANTLVARGERAGDRVIVVAALQGLDAGGLKALATSAATFEPRAAVALFSASTPALVVVARGSGGGIDAGAVLKTLVNRFGGKGGGKAELAQGGGLNAPAGELIEAARDLLRSHP
jgi:alanyl-tRNA synthetase